MRSSAAVAVLVVAASVPAFSAPLAVPSVLSRDAPTSQVATTQDESGAFGITKILGTLAGFLFNKREEDGLYARDDDLFQRDYSEILARDVPTDESGAINFGKIISTVGGLLGSFLNRRDAELLVRSLENDELFQREYSELLARADPTSVDESGAINFGKIISTVGGILGSFLNRRDAELLVRGLASDDMVLKREVAEILARADPSTVPTDESGAINVGHLISTGLSIFNSLFGREDFEEVFARSLESDALLKRDFVELLSRNDVPVPTDESGALKLGPIINTIGGLLNTFFGKREYSELLARADPSAPVDDSQALNIGHLISTGLSIFNGLFGREDFEEVLARSLESDQVLKREFVDILSRNDVPVQTDESGALKLGPIINTIGGLLNTFFGKREYSDLLARADPSAPVDDSQALNIGHLISTGLSIFNGLFGREDFEEVLARSLESDHVLKREFVDLLSRNDVPVQTDESGALKLGPIISTIGGLLNTFFGKREELELLAREHGLQMREYSARSLNELD